MFCHPAVVMSQQSGGVAVVAAAGVGVTSETQCMEAELSDVSNQLRTTRQLIARLHSLNVDATEYACLKAIVLFKPGTDIYLFYLFIYLQTTIIMQ